MAKDDPLLTQRQAAEYLNLSIRTLQRWRTDGIGPPSIVLPNGYRRYRRSALDRWLAKHGDRPGGRPGG
jgi:DNA-binding transcriptional MerR regulator